MKIFLAQILNTSFKGDEKKTKPESFIGENTPLPYPSSENFKGYCGINNSSDSHLLMRLQNEKILSTSGNEIIRFTENEIENLMKLGSSDKKLLIKLLDFEDVDASGTKSPDLLAFQIEDLFEYISNNKNIYNKLSDDNIKLFRMLNSSRYSDLLNNKKVMGLLTDNVLTDMDTVKVSQPYIEGNYQFMCKKNNLTKIIDFKLEYDNPVVLGKETVSDNGKIKKVRRENPDGSYIILEQEYKTSPYEDIPLSQKKTFFDSNGVQYLSEVINHSKDKPDMYTLNVYERGLNKPMAKKPAATVKMYGSKKQGSKIIKTISSSDGTVTKQIKTEGPNGFAMTYEIIDKSGQTLCYQERTSRKINENHYITSFNHQKYDVKFDSKEITASKIDNNGNVSKYVKLDSRTIDPELFQYCKKLPGDYLFDISDIGVKIKCDKSITYNAFYLHEKNTIILSDDLKSNLFVLAHELGHAKDYTRSSLLAEDEPFQRMFSKELESYKKCSSDTEGHAIDYFTQEYDSIWGLNEITAETGALMSGMQNIDYDGLIMRGLILQQHFPRTMAYIANNIDE